MDRLAKRLSLLSLPTLALLGLLAAGCGGANGADGAAAESENGNTAKPSVRVETLLLTPTTFEDVIQLTGTVEALNDATLSAQAAGTIEYLAPLGRRVGRGGALARLDQGLLRAAVQQAEAQVESAQAQFALAEDNLGRQEPLYRDSIISPLEFQNVRTQFNQARAGLRQAEAGLAQTRKQLQYTVVTAPFAGTVEERFVETGEQVTPGQPVVRVVNTSGVKVAAGVPERYASDIEVGSSVRLDFKAYRSGLQQGRVTFVGSAIDPANRTFLIEIEVPNTGGPLKPEMIAEVLVTRETLQDVLVIPRSAVLRDEDGNTLFVVRQQNGETVAERRSVVLGVSYGGRVIVERGLEAGEEVLVLGQNNITEGGLLEVVQQYRTLDATGVPRQDADAQE